MRICTAVLLRRTAVFVVLVTIIGEARLNAAPAASDSARPSTTTGIKELRQKAKERQRRIIYNNDGGDVVRQMTEPTVANLLEQRTNSLAGTQVDTLCYCTKSTGLDLFTHFTKIGTLFTRRDGGYDYNQTGALFDKGIDPLRVMIDFSKRNNIEFFWSIRMNDTHDASTAEYGPINFRANRLKSAHPEYMLGTAKHRPKHGAWTALDYGRPEVRDVAYRLIEEVCRKYDVDGVELDFFRHPVYFKSNASGKPATDVERAAMTELLVRIRNMTEEVGQSRGRPILIAIRMPDSVEYCRSIGLDLERWLATDLLDLYVPGSYYQLNEWDDSVALGHKYGVKVYPSLDESRVGDESARAARMTNLAYRARAADVWRAAADGVYLFNFSNSDKSGNALFHELGSPQILAGLDKDYFGSVRGAAKASGGNLPFTPYLKIETINPQNPKKIMPGATETAKLYLGENVESKTPTHLKLRLNMHGAFNADDIQIAINAHNLELKAVSDDWFESVASTSELRLGPNTVAVTLAANASAPATWSDVVLEVRHAKGQEP
jgi:hypothetical protein